jgi:cyclophilin family peptidyl-prolyl cis-trans isomerase
MGNKRARDRQLAKLAARRQAERRARQRRRGRIVTIVAVVAIGLAGTGLWVLAADDEPAAAPSSQPAASASPDRSEPLGTVQNEADIPADVACGASAPRGAASAKPQFAKPPPQRVDPEAAYTATIATSCGEIAVELDPANTPIAVNNFVFLARKGFYDGLWIHRDAPGFVIQGGDPLGTGLGGPGYGFTIESNAKLRFADHPYLLAYANNGQPDSNGSQFFITVGEQEALDPPNGPYTAFGTVVGGQDVVDTINELKTTDNGQGEQSLPLEAVYIESVTVEETKA